MRLRWTTSSTIAAALLAAAGISRAADPPTVVVGGIVRATTKGVVPTTTLSLCYRPKKGESCLTKSAVSASGLFILASPLPPYVQGDLYVISDGPGIAKPVVVSASLVPGQYNIRRAITDDIVIPCLTGAIPKGSDVPACVTAMGETKQANVKVGRERADAADGALKTAVAALLDRADGWDPKKVSDALDALSRPDAARGLPALAVAWRGDLLKKQTERYAVNRAACSILPDPRFSNDPTAYAKLADRCEGFPGQLTGGGTEVVSLTQSPLAFSDSQKDILLSWPAQPGAVCIEATTIAADKTWRMQTKVQAGVNHFRWELDGVHKAKLRASDLGVVATACDVKGAPYVPLRFPGAAAPSDQYEVVVRSSHKLAKVFREIEEGSGSGPGEVTFPREPINFPPGPTATIPLTIKPRLSGTREVTVRLDLYPPKGKKEEFPFTMIQDGGSAR